MIKAQGVHQDVAHHVYFRQLRPFACGDAVTSHASREKQIAKPIDNQSVNFLGHINVEATRSCHQMGQQNTLFLGYDGSGEGRSEVVYHDNHVCGVVL